jgi:peptidoglycan hydrolase CwlO-like protein
LDWMFLAFILAAVGYSANIYKEYRADLQVLETRQQFFENERYELGEKISAVEADQAEIQTRTTEIRELAKPLQVKLARKMAEIEHLTDEDERRGKFKVE